MQNYNYLFKSWKKTLYARGDKFKFEIWNLKLKTWKQITPFIKKKKTWWKCSTWANQCKQTCANSDQSINRLSLQCNLHHILHIILHILCIFYAYFWNGLHICELFAYYADCILICILFDIFYTIFFIFIFIQVITYSAYYGFYLIHILHILQMHKGRVLASGDSCFAAAMLFGWFSMTGPNCSHATTDIRHGRSVSHHNLRPESQLILLASRKGIVPVSPTGTRGNSLSIGDTGTTY